jgi:hypothetical protein
MPLEHDYEFGRAAVSRGELQQDQLEECVEIFVALERVGSRQRLWDVVRRKGYMGPKEIQALLEELDVAAAPPPKDEWEGPTPAETDEGDEANSDYEVPVDAEVEPVEDPLALIGAEGLPEELRKNEPARRRFAPGELALACVKGPAKGERFVLASERTVLGRDHSADIVLDTPQVSRRHAEIVFRGQVIVRDLGSRNGVYVNGARVNESVIRPGETLHLGRVMFIVTEA